MQLQNNDNNHSSYILTNTDLHQLETAAQDLFTYLDTLSDQIRIIEKKLFDLKAHFPFRKKVQEEEGEYIHTEERHSAFPGTVQGAYTTLFWYLSWEQDETSKNYRIFLISEEKEMVCSEVYVDQFRNFEVNSKINLKKPLIETSLAIRSKYGKYLKDFVVDFTTELEDLKGSLLSNDLSEEEILF